MFRNLRKDKDTLKAENSEKFGGRIRVFIKAAGITALAFLLSYLFVAPFSASLTALFSSSEKSDFVMPDLFCQIADGRPVRKLEDRVIILDIGRSNRAEIIESLSILPLCGPRAVVLDINFEDPGDNDELLLETLKTLPNAVLPLGVEKVDSGFVISDRPFFYSTLSGVHYGAVNFPTKRKGATVREYAHSYPLVSGGKLYSLPVAAAQSAGYAIPAETGNKEVDTDYIDYPSKTIPVVRSEELADRVEEFTDKIVLVGSMQEAGDLFQTPLNHGMAGIEVHAYALSTVLDGKKIDVVADWIVSLAAILICYLIVLGAVGIKTNIKGFVLRVAQITFLYLFVRVGYWLYVDRNIVADFSQPVLMITFGLFSFDVWNGIACMIETFRNWLKRRKQKREIINEYSN